MGQDAFEAFLFTIRAIKHLVKIKKEAFPLCTTMHEPVFKGMVPNVKEFPLFFTNCFHSSFRNPGHIQAGLWLLTV